MGMRILTGCGIHPSAFVTYAEVHLVPASALPAQRKVDLMGASGDTIPWNEYAQIVWEMAPLLTCLIPAQMRPPVTILGSHSLSILTLLQALHLKPIYYVSL